MNLRLIVNWVFYTIRETGKGEPMIYTVEPQVHCAEGSRKMIPFPAVFRTNIVKITRLALGIYWC